MAEDQPYLLATLGGDVMMIALFVTFTTADGTLRRGEWRLSNISGDGTDTLSFSGTVADINTAPALISGPPDKNGLQRLPKEVTVSSISRTISIIISLVTDAPTRPAVPVSRLLKGRKSSPACGPFPTSV